VGWIYQYALIDRSGQQDLAQLRSLQDWFLKFELKTISGVAEVATIGGMVRQYQVVLNPDKLAAYRIPVESGSRIYRVGAVRHQTIPSFGNQRLMVKLYILMLHSFLSCNANNSVLKRER
jgi:hypothetical protein